MSPSVESISGSLDALEKRVEAIEVGVQENTKATLEGNRDVREVLEMFQTVKGGIKVLGWIGNVVRWVGYIAAAGLAVYGAWNAIVHTAPKP